MFTYNVIITRKSSRKLKTAPGIFGILSIAAPQFPTTRRHDVSFSHVALRAAGGPGILRRGVLRLALHRAPAGGVVSFRRGIARSTGHAFDGRSAHGSHRQRQRIAPA